MASDKKFSVKIWHVVVLSIGIGFLIALGVIRQKRNVDRIHNTLETRLAQIKRYEIVVDSLTELVAEAELIVWGKDQDILLSKAQVERLKALRLSDVKLIGELRLQVSAFREDLEVRASRDTIVRLVQVVDNRNMIELPISFGSQDEWLTQYAEVDTTGTGSIGFVLEPPVINLTMGSRGWLRPDYVSDISVSNPYIEIDRNQFQVVSTKKTKPFLIGTGLGLLAGGVGVFFLTR